MDQFINLTVFFENSDGISKGYRKVTRKLTRYQKIGERETGLVTVFGNQLWAERYPNTAWIVSIQK